MPAPAAPVHPISLNEKPATVPRLTRRTFEPATWLAARLSAFVAFILFTLPGAPGWRFASYSEAPQPTPNFTNKPQTRLVAARRFLCFAMPHADQ
jgi:hypothetical protein